MDNFAVSLSIIPVRKVLSHEIIMIICIVVLGMEKLEIMINSWVFLVYIRQQMEETWAAII